MSASLDISRFCKKMPESLSLETCVSKRRSWDSPDGVLVEDNYIQVARVLQFECHILQLLFLCSFQSEGGYGPNVATDAHALELQTAIHGFSGLHDGELITMHKATGQDFGSSSTGPGLCLLVKDALGRIITEGADDAGAFLASSAQR